MEPEIKMSELVKALDEALDDLLGHELVNGYFRLCSEIFETDKFCIAGGAIVNTINGDEVKDIDCFFFQQDEYNKAIENIHYRAKLTKERKRSKVFKLKDGREIDVVLCEYAKNFNEIIDSFDMVHTQHYYNPDEGLVSRVNAELYAKNKILHLNCVTYPWLTLGRIAKKIKEGWLIDSNQERNILDYCYKAPWGPQKESEYSF